MLDIAVLADRCVSYCRILPFCFPSCDFVITCSTRKIPNFLSAIEDSGGMQESRMMLYYEYSENGTRFRLALVLLCYKLVLTASFPNN